MNLDQIIPPQPHVEQAWGCERAHKKQPWCKRYYIVAFIADAGGDKTIAITHSDDALAFAAKEMDDALTSSGITWDGSYRIGTPEEVNAEAQRRRLILAC